MAKSNQTSPNAARSASRTLRSKSTGKKSKTAAGGLPQPDDPDCKMWRYMDFTKFVCMLERKALYFPRIDMLGDPFECSLSRIARESRAWHLNMLSLRKAVNGTELERSVATVREWERKRVFASCWHMGDYESDAMWKLYANTDEAVAVQSTYSRLQHSLDTSADTSARSYRIGKVTYLDYDSDEWPAPEEDMVWRAMTKRKGFEHEREVRAVLVDEPKPGTRVDSDATYPEIGKTVAVNLTDLVVAVYVAPFSREWFKKLVEDVLNRYRVDVPVQQSSLGKKPGF